MRENPVTGEIVRQLRSDRAARKDFIKSWESKTNSFMDVSIRFCPVREWLGYTYLFTGKIDLVEGRQTIEVLDVTDCLDQMALFPEWAGQDNEYWHGGNGSRRYAALIQETPDEGREELHVLGEDGKYIWRYNFADLPVRVVSGSTGDYRRTLADQMEQIEQSVEAGGSIGL
jgi:hypothetical protein